MTDLVFDLLTQAVKNTNININLNTKTTPSMDTPIPTSIKKEELSSSPEHPREVNVQQHGLVKADLVQLVKDLEGVSCTLKKINVSVHGSEHDIFFMLQNFDTILNSVKLVLNAV